MKLAINIKNYLYNFMGVLCSFDYKKGLIRVTSSMEILLEEVLKVKHINNPALHYSTCTN